MRHLWLGWLLNNLLHRSNIDVLLVDGLLFLIVLILFLILFVVVWVFVLDLLLQIIFWNKGWSSKVWLFGLLLKELLHSRLCLLITLVPNICRRVLLRRLFVEIVLLSILTIVWWYISFPDTSVDFRNYWWLWVLIPLYRWSTLSTSPSYILIARHHRWFKSTLILLLFELDLIGIFIMPLAPHHIVSNSSIWKCFLWIFNHFQWLLIKVWLETVVHMILIFIFFFQLAIVLIILLLVPINLFGTGWTWIIHILDLSIVDLSAPFVNPWVERWLIFLSNFIDLSLLLRCEQVVFSIDAHVLKLPIDLQYLLVR